MGPDNLQSVLVAHMPPVPLQAEQKYWLIMAFQGLQP